MKKRTTNKTSRRSPKSSANRAGGRKRMFSKRKGGVIDASMILENRNRRSTPSPDSKKASL